LWGHDQSDIVDVGEDVNVVKEVRGEGIPENSDGCAETQAEGSGRKAFALENPIKDGVTGPRILAVTNPDGGPGGREDESHAWKHAWHLLFD